MIGNHYGTAAAHRHIWQIGTPDTFGSPAESDLMNDPKPQRSSDRLQDIERRIDKMQGQQQADDAPRHNGLPAGMGAILGRVATEMVAGVLVGAFIGWVLDRWLETSPLFLVLMFFLGAAAGMLNVWRIASGRGLVTGYFDEHRRDDGDTGKDE